MRRLAILVSLVVLLGAVQGLGARRDAQSQDATPESIVVAEGVSFVPLALAPAVDLPPSPAALSLSRYRLDPGAVQTTDATDHSLALIQQESGSSTVRLAAPVMVLRGATGVPEAIPADTAFVLDEGDSFAWPPYVAGEVRNDGTTPAITLVVLIVPAKGATATP